MKPLGTSWLVLSVCLFGSSVAPAVDPAPAFTKEARGDWYVLAAHQNNKNIAQGKRVGSRSRPTAWFGTTRRRPTRRS